MGCMYITFTRPAPSPSSCRMISRKPDVRSARITGIKSGHFIADRCTQHLYNHFSKSHVPVLEQLFHFTSPSLSVDDRCLPYARKKQTLWDFDSFTSPSRALPSLHSFPWPSANIMLFSYIRKMKTNPTGYSPSNRIRRRSR